jgi:hypothetical protein
MTQTVWDRDAFYQRLDEINSLHEAGHTVAALALGVAVSEVFLQYPDDHENFGYCARSNNVSDEDDIVIMFAGAGAEVIHRGISWTFAFRSAARGDWQKAQEPIEAARHAGLTNRQVIELMALGADSLREASARVAATPPLPKKVVIATAKTRCLTILREHWDSVVALAAALRSNRRLTDNEVQVIWGMGVRRAQDN